MAAPVAVNAPSVIITGFSRTPRPVVRKSIGNRLPDRRHHEVADQDGRPDQVQRDPGLVTHLGANPPRANSHTGNSDCRSAAVWLLHLWENGQQFRRFAFSAQQ
jgi:hypothetical protein